MPIQIPRIQSEGNIQATQAPRVQSPGLNIEGPMASTLGAAESAGQEIVKFRDQMEYQEADNIGTQKDNAFQEWDKKKKYGDLNHPETPGILFQKGDPKAIFQQYDKEAQEKLTELSTPRDGESWSDLTQTVVNRRLNHRATELHGESLTAYGNQKYKFDGEVKDTNVAFAQKGLVGPSANVDPAHPETFGPVQAKIEDIKSPIISHALMYGGATKTDDGTVIATPTTKQEIAKAVSDGLYSTIKNLYDSDQGDGKAIEKADAIKQQFADQLDPFHKDVLSTKGREAEVKKKGLDLAKKLMYAKDPEAVANAEKDDEVRMSGEKFAAEQRNHLDFLKKSREQQSFGGLLDHIDTVQKSGNPYAGVQTMLSDKTVSDAWQYLSAPQRKILESRVSPPKNSDPAAVRNALEVLGGAQSDKYPDLSKITPTQLATIQHGLGTDKTGSMLTQRLNELLVPSSAQRNSIQQHALALLKSSAQAKGLVYNDNTARSDIAKDGSQADKLNDLQSEFLPMVSNMPGNPSIKDLKQMADDFVAKKLQIETQDSSKSSWNPLKRFWGGTEVPAAKTGLQIPGKTVDTPKKTELQIRSQAMDEMKSTSGREPSGPELDAYVLKYRKRLEK